MGKNGSRGFCGKMVLNLQTFIGGFLQFVDRAPAGHTVFKLVQSFSSGKEAVRVAVHDWYRTTAKDWFSGAIR